MLQRQVAWRLGTLGDERGVPALAQLLEARDPTVRAYAYDALARLLQRGVEAAGPVLSSYAGQKPLGPLAPPEF